jgi:hypothetical protein
MSVAGEEFSSKDQASTCSNIQPPGGNTCDWWATLTTECNNQWFADNNYCAQSCGHCSDGGGSSSSGSSSSGSTTTCTDNRPTGTQWDEATCQMWATQTGECGQAWMIDNHWCDASCGRCGDSAPAPSGGSCTNVRPTGTGWDAATCDMWATQTTECNNSWMVDNHLCDESCGRCSDVTVTGTTSYTAPYCDGGQGDWKKHMTSVAVLLMKDTGRLAPQKDLALGTIAGQQAVVISAAGKSRCQSRSMGDCDRTADFLALQDPALGSSAGGGIIDSNVFRNKLVSNFNSGMNFVNSHGGVDSAFSMPELTYYDTVDAALQYGADLGFCGLHARFTVEGSSGNMHEALRFFGFNPGWLNGNWGCGGDPYNDPVCLYGDNSNAYFTPATDYIINFLNQNLGWNAQVHRTSDGKELFDADPSLVDDPSLTSSGSCVDSCLASGHQFAGDCCVCNGVQGNFTQIRRTNYACK